MAITLSDPKNRDLYMHQQFDQKSVHALHEAINNIQNADLELKDQYKKIEAEYKPKPIKIYIDSYGGSVYQALGLISLIEECWVPVHTIVTGCAMSCGFLLAISGHKRFAYQKATLMCHSVSWNIGGDIQHIQNDLEELKRLQDLIGKMVAEKTKIKMKTLEKYKKDRKDWYIPAAEALKLGIVDELI